MTKKRKDELGKYIATAEKELDMVYKKITLPQIDIWLECYKKNPAAQQGLLMNPFYKLIKSEGNKILSDLSGQLEHAELTKVSALQGGISGWRSILKLFDRIEKINTEK